MLATVLTWLTDPWSQAIDRRALAELALLGIAAGALGCWLVTFQLAYAAESLAHAMLPGLVLAALVGAPLVLGGAAGLLVAGGGVALAARVPAVGRDTAVGVVVTTLFGLGGLLALSPESPPRLGELLFGDVLGTESGDLLLAAGLAAVVLLVLWVAHPRLLAVGFDRTSAPLLGVRTAVVDAVLLVVLGLTLLIAVQGLGNLLVVAVLVAPAAAGRIVTRRMGPMMVTSAAIAVACGAIGLQVSYHARTAAGASVALALVAAYVLALAVSPGIARRRRAA